MGDRALIQLTDGSEVSPVLYLHWGGCSVAALLDGFATQMGGRIDDVSYAFARLVGRACNRSGGDTEALSVGVMSREEALTPGDSHGDAGVFLVNVKTKTVAYGGGYGPKSQEDAPKDFKRQPFVWSAMKAR